MRIIEFQTGSEGNCCVAYEDDVLVMFDCGLSMKKLNQYLKANEIDLSSFKNFYLLISHEHTDHYNDTTVSELLLTYNPIMIWGDRLYVDYKVQIQSKAFSHGDLTSYGYVVEFPSWYTVGYIIDIDSSNIADSKFEIVKYKKFKEFKNLSYLFIEANYDEEKEKEYLSADVSYLGYDASSGFKRHLSKQESEAIIKYLSPTDFTTIHHSSRFF